MTDPQIGPASSVPSASSSKQLGAAADLIRTLDEAFNSMSSAAKDAGSEAEMARRNAKLAGEIARRYGGAARCSPRRVAFPSVQQPKPTASSHLASHQPPQQGSSRKKIAETDGQQQERRHRSRRPVVIDTGVSFQPSQGGESKNPTFAETAGAGGTPSGGTLSAAGDAASPATPEASQGGEVGKLGSAHRSLPSPVSSPQSTAANAGTGGGTTTAATPRHVQGDRLAKAHAEDVLSLALELQRSRESLDTERRSHEKTRTALREERGRAAALEAQIARLQSDLGSEAERYGREIDRLREENARANLRVQAAEEDAQAALDLAKGSAESREQVEGWLQMALNEIEGLRAAANGNTSLVTAPGSETAAAPSPATAPPQPTTTLVQPKGNPSTQLNGAAVPVPTTTTVQLPRSDSSPPVMQYTTASTTTTTTVTTTSEQTTTSAVYSSAQGQQSDTRSFAPSATLTTPPRVTKNDNDPRSRSMVAAGRDLFRKATTPNSASAAPTIPEEHTADDEGPNSYTLRLTKESADKRKKLRGLLANLGDGPSHSDKKLLLGPSAHDTPKTASTPAALTSSSSSSSSTASSRVDMILTVTCNNVTKMLRESGARIGLGEQWWATTTATREGPEVEETARSFCNLVESKVSKQDEEFKELEAFCDHLERKIANGGDFGA